MGGIIVSFSGMEELFYCRGGGVVGGILRGGGFVVSVFLLLYFNICVLLFFFTLLCSWVDGVVGGVTWARRH